MTSIAEIRDSYQLLILGLSDPKDTPGILAGLAGHPKLVPCLTAFTGGGALTLNPVVDGAVLSIEVPVRHIRLEGLMKQRVETKEGQVGLRIDLPGDLSCVSSAWDKVTTDPTAEYQWTGKFGFLKNYRQELNVQCGRLMTRVRTTRVEGIQGQADTDPRLGPHQVGMGPVTAARFLAQLQRSHPELQSHTTLGGVELLLLRFPVVPPKKATWWFEVVVLHDRPEQLLYVNPVTWEAIFDGDTDGDLAYLGAPDGRLSYRTPKTVGPYPEFRITGGGSLFGTMRAALRK